jgi:hypothetical protein
VRACAVSFVSTSGVKHAVEIQAESLYEAAVEGVRAIAEQWGQEPGPLTPINVEVKPPPVTHNLTLRQIRQWTGSNAISPKDKLAKEHLKERLGDRG